MKVIQLSDTHLFADDALQIFGVKSNLAFKEVVNKILLEDIHDADLIFLTGDISQDNTLESYQVAVDQLLRLNIPIYWIPGNHDHLPSMQTVFESAKNFHHQPYLSTANWDFVFLNTKQEGSESGYLAPLELEELTNQLKTSSLNKKTAIVMHHHPIPVSTPLIDNYILKNREEFLNIVIDTNVTLIICGHVHGDYQINHHAITLESSPATCLQWQKGTTELKIESRIGYKIYYFDEDGYRALAKLW